MRERQQSPNSIFTQAVSRVLHRGVRQPFIRKEFNSARFQAEILLYRPSHLIPIFQKKLLFDDIKIDERTWRTYSLKEKAAHRLTPRQIEWMRSKLRNGLIRHTNEFKDISPLGKVNDFAEIVMAFVLSPYIPIIRDQRNYEHYPHHVNAAGLYESATQLLGEKESQPTIRMDITSTLFAMNYIHAVDNSLPPQYGGVTYITREFDRFLDFWPGT